MYLWVEYMYTSRSITGRLLYKILCENLRFLIAMT